MTAPRLRVTGLAVPFGTGPGLADVSFAVARGERLAVVGASGAGKTSLLRAVAGLGPASAGRIEVDGRDVGGRPPERRDAVHLHQTPLLFPHLSVFENVAFPLRVRGAGRAATRETVRGLLAAVGLDGFEARAPRTLSGGQKHRVALARAVAARPAVLLLDEPFSALDPALRDEVRDALVRLQAEAGAAVVLVTHDLDEAGLLGDRIAVLMDGRVAQLAPPGDLFARPATLAVARFLGLPNEVPGTVRDGTFESPLGRLPAPDLPPGPAVAVLRADALGPAGGGAPATVERVLRRAHGTTLRLRVAGVERALEMRAAPDAGEPAPGAAIAVAWDAARVLVYAAGS